jgi:heme/copper-type cytochrome/quinol oxidase subunit 2
MAMLTIFILGVLAVLVTGAVAIISANSIDFSDKAKHSIYYERMEMGAWLIRIIILITLSVLIVQFLAQLH